MISDDILDYISYEDFQKILHGGYPIGTIKNAIAEQQGVNYESLRIQQWTSSIQSNWKLYHSF